MGQRTITAVLALAIFLPIVYVGGLLFNGLMAILGLIGLYELARMKNVKLMSPAGVIASVFLLLLVFPSDYLTLLGLTNPYLLLSGLVLLLLSLMVFLPETVTFEEIGVLIVGALYLGFGFGWLIEIRTLDLLALLYLLIAIWSTDIGAYTFGSRFGKHRLAPTISPNKSIEGSIGGILLAVVTSICFMLIFPPADGLKIGYLLLTVLLSVAGQLGDLVESAIKRYFKVKDSGNLLPGHGGVLDRFDSLLFASFVYIVWLSYY